MCLHLDFKFMNIEAASEHSINQNLIIIGVGGTKVRNVQWKSMGYRKTTRSVTKKKKKKNEHNDPPVCGGDKSTLQTVERWEWWLTGRHGAHCLAVEWWFPPKPLHALQVTWPSKRQTQWQQTYKSNHYALHKISGNFCIFCRLNIKYNPPESLM